MSPNKISRISVFSELKSKTVSSVEKRIVWNSYSKDVPILGHHDETTDVFFIYSGSVKATTFSYSGKEISYQMLGQGEMFGELSGIDLEGRTTSIVVLENSVIGHMSSQDFWWVLENHPEVVKAVLFRLTGLIRFLCGRVYEYGALGVNDRIRAEILKHARSASKDGFSAIVTNMPTHEEIANRVTTHREAVTKEFSYLTKNDYISKKGKTVIIPNISKLESLIEEII